MAKTRYAPDRGLIARMGLTMFLLGVVFVAFVLALYLVLSASGRGGAATVTFSEDVTAAIREPRVTEAASKVSMVPGVRRAMREEQRRIGSRQSVVMEGRDIGTVVFPEAQVKIYLDADPEVRAGRRAAEIGASPDDVARELAERDNRDRTRAEAPLTQAPDADYLDSSGLTPTDVEEAILKLVRDRTSNGKEHR